MPCFCLGLWLYGRHVNFIGIIPHFDWQEAFTTIDQNKDGFIDHNDLVEMLTSLGKNPSEEYIEEMIQQAPGPINFTMFLTLFGEKMTGSDPEDVIMSAFKCFDNDGKGEAYYIWHLFVISLFFYFLGVIDEEFIRNAMMTMGDRWSEESVDDLFRGAPISGGQLNYQAFTKLLTGSDMKEDDQ